MVNIYLFDIKKINVIISVGIANLIVISSNECWNECLVDILESANIIFVSGQEIIF